MTRIANPGLPRLHGLALAAALLMLAAGCSENTVPQITQLDAEPNCDIITTHPDGDYLEVRFFARASGGNVKSEPTGANSPLDWNWDFGDGSGAGNVVNPVHRYTQPGDYTVVLTVKDDDGDSDTRSIEVVVGSTYGDLDILQVSAETVGDSRIAFTRRDSVSRFTGWEASFDGHILTPCPVGGLFQTYTWRWDFGDSTSQSHIGSPTHVYPPTAQDYEIYLTVTENNTQVSRSDTVSTTYPSGARLSNTELILLPGRTVNLRMDGILTVGLTGIDVTISWPPEYLITADAVATPEVTNEGFTLTTDSSVPGVLQMSFQSPSGMTLPDTVIPFADISFTRPPGATPVVPSGLMRVKLDSISVTTAGGGTRAANGVGGEMQIDNDCNGNDLADRYEFDCDGNGVADECDIANDPSIDCNNNGVPDQCDIDVGISLDCNRNGIPDECDISSGAELDCDNDGIPDSCEPDCNGNGIADDCDISSGTSVDCDGNGVPDECQPDCNNNGIADVCDIRDGTSLDCNADIPGSAGAGVPDECEPDCNNNGTPDECDIANLNSLDCNNNGIPDECEVDCNGNGIPDSCDIQNGTSQDFNGNDIPDECE